jgi:hypothetical protein
MKNRIIKSLLGLYLVTTAGICYGQNNSSEEVKPILTADSLASGNVKDILTSFFQLAFNHLTSPDKELNFNSNPFAIILKSNPGLAKDTYYYKYRALRKTNFSFGIKLDSSFRFNGFSSGVKYALIDQRDSSTSKLLFQNLRNDNLGKERDQLQLKLVEYANTIQNINEKKKFNAAIRDFFNKDTPFNNLSDSLKAAVKKIIADDKESYPVISDIIENNPSSNMVTEERKVYESLKNQIKDDLLWTIGVSDTTYKNQFFFSNILLKTELLKGIGRPKRGSNWEFNVQAGLNFADDTLRKGRDLKRSILSFEPGFNWVVRNKSNDHSFLEFEFSGSYTHNFGSLYAGGKRDSLTFNGTIRVRIIDDIWIPLEIKYDPESGNVFGFINIRANFSGLGKLAKSLLNN